MKNKITIGHIFSDFAFCTILLASYIGLFMLATTNFLYNMILMCISIIFIFIFYINMIFLGYKIESYLIDHKVLKEENNEKDNII